MSRPQKILTGVLWVLAIVASVSFIVASSRNHPHPNPLPEYRERGQSDDLPVLAQVPHFQLIDQDNKPFTNETLHGKPWVADFIFTTCGQACPMMTAKMAKLQKTIAD